MVSAFLLILGSAFLAATSISYLNSERNRPVRLDQNSKVVWNLARIVSDTLYLRRKIIVLGAALYSIFFSFLDGILIYQPGASFTSLYETESSKVLFTTCCGPPGYIPIIDIYLPSVNFGIQIIPISIILMIVISFLVGLNVSLLYTALNSSASTRISLPIKGRASNPKNSGLASGLTGGIFGLFAGCPTCAAAFFMSMISGGGATAFSFWISKFQPLIVGITIPLLLGSVLWQAKSIRIFLEGCTV